MFRIVEKENLKKIVKSEIVVCNSENNELTNPVVEVVPAADDVVKYFFRVHHPMWIDGDSGEKDFLLNIYTEIFEKALHLGCSSIQIPLISEEIPFFPLDVAYSVAILQSSYFHSKNDIDVVLVISRPEAIFNNDKIFPELEEYINLVYNKGYKNPLLVEDSSRPGEIFVVEGEGQPELHDILQLPNQVKQELLEAGKPFSEHLRAIMEKKMVDSSRVCRRANFDRQYFSKLMNDKLKKPSKNRMFMLAIALHLTLEEATDLLKFLGYSFSFNEKIDIIVKHFISIGNYDMPKIESAIYKITQKTLCDYE